MAKQAKTKTTRSSPKTVAPSPKSTLKAAPVAAPLPRKGRVAQAIIESTPVATAMPVVPPMPVAPTPSPEAIAAAVALLRAKGKRSVSSKAEAGQWWEQAIATQLATTLEASRPAAKAIVVQRKRSAPVVKAEREGTLPSANPLMDRLRARRGMTSEQKRADVFARLKAVKPNSADEDVTTKVLRLLTKGWVSSKAIRIVRGFSDGKRCNFHTQRTLAERNGFKLEWADNPKDDTDFLFRFVQSDQS